MRSFHPKRERRVGFHKGLEMRRRGPPLETDRTKGCLRWEAAVEEEETEEEEDEEEAEVEEEDNARAAVVETEREEGLPRSLVGVPAPPRSERTEEAGEEAGDERAPPLMQEGKTSSLPSPPPSSFHSFPEPVMSDANDTNRGLVGCIRGLVLSLDECDSPPRCVGSLDTDDDVGDSDVPANTTSIDPGKSRDPRDPRRDPRDPLDVLFLDVFDSCNDSCKVRRRMCSSILSIPKTRRAFALFSCRSVVERIVEVSSMERIPVWRCGGVRFQCEV